METKTWQQSYGSMIDRRSLLEALDAQTASKFVHTRRLQMERENWSWANPSLWRAQKIITKFSVQTFLWSSSCGHAFNTSSTADGSLKVTNPNPLQYGYKNRKATIIMLHIAYSSDMPFTIQSWSRLLSELEGRKGVSSAASALPWLFSVRIHHNQALL